MTDDTFIQAFESAAISRADWTHEAHIRMAWIYCTREGSLADAVQKAGEGIRRLNAANGVDPMLYHETVTVAFVTLVYLRVEKFGGEWIEFRDAHAELFDKEVPILQRFYTAETLGSEAARGVFVPPDIPFAT